MLPDRIWIHPGDPLQCYITKAIDGAAPYIRESEPCVWTPDPPDIDGHVGWQTSCCGEDHRMYDDPEFFVCCPYCGARIVLEEGGDAT